MKLTYTFLFLILSYCAFSQDTTFYDSWHNKVNSINLCQYYEIIQRSESDTNKVTEFKYYKSGQINSETNYYPYSEKLNHGKYKLWYEDGQLWRDMDYENGDYNGQVLTYWENGQLRRKDNYKNGVFVEGTVWNSDGKEVDYYDFEVMPEFPGGIIKFYEFLKKNTKYPKKSRKNEIMGIVQVGYTVERDGQITNVKIIKSVNEELDAEAMRVVKLMPDWTPGMVEGNLERFGLRLPFRFTLK